MTAVGIVFRRTAATLRHALSVAFVEVLFLAVTALAFAFGLERVEGLSVVASAIWATAVSPFVPVLAAFLGMDVLADDRRTGRLDLLLSVAVRERDIVVGKLLGVFARLVRDLILSFGATLVALAFLAPNALAGTTPSAVLAALFAVLVQGMLWCALAVFFSALCTRSSVAFLMTILTAVVVPRVGWLALRHWSPAGALAYGEMPLDAHVSDMAGGLLSSGTVLSYIILTGAFLLATVKLVSALRYVGVGFARMRFSFACVQTLNIAVAVLLSTLALRLDVVCDVPIRGAETLAPCLDRVLSASEGTVTATAFVPRHDPSFRTVSRRLRALARAADALGGATLRMRFVDPHWDVGASERLVRQGVPARSLVFERGGRSAFVSLDEGLDDRLVASAFQRVTLPPPRRDVFWTTGHGESAFDAYGPFGMSDIARDLVREGYRNATIDLAAGPAVPATCAFVIIAGARTEFSRVELSRLDAYVRAGGRLLVLMGPPGRGGVAPMLPSWGLRTDVRTLSAAHTLTGSDAVVTDFARHPVSFGLGDAQVVMERPLALSSSSVASEVSGVDRIAFEPIARVGDAPVIAAVSRGAGVGSDLALRPMRIVVIGDATFALNGQLSVRANGNRALFLNAVSYLAGAEVLGSAGTAGRLASGLDRTGRRRFVWVTALAVPGGFLLLALAYHLKRRRRA